MGHKDSCEKCTGQLSDSCDERQGIFVCTELVGHEGKHRACSYGTHPAAEWDKMILCSLNLKLELENVSFPCQGDLGHHGQCFHEIAGAGRNARVTWTPSNRDIMEELVKVTQRKKT